mmetsp:Transcript_25082/g.70046  ORF Transcript_25082/g.70046 Transcript_25082/m.70046 type:complete len:83 (+) Transcript_25082:385-633(+)
MSRRSDVDSDKEFWDDFGEEAAHGDIVIKAGQQRWRHKPSREKCANKKRLRMDMEERIRQLQEEGEGEFAATYKLSVGLSSI